MYLCLTMKFCSMKSNAAHIFLFKCFRMGCCPLRTGIEKFSMVELKSTDILRDVFFSNTVLLQFKADVGIN